MVTKSKSLSLVLCSFLLPLTALADISGTTTVNASSQINLETGAAGGAGGDLGFNGTQLTPIGSAKIYKAGTGASAYSLYTQATIQAFGPIMSSSAISISTNDVIAAQDGAGHYAKLLVTAVSSSSVTLQYTTYGATAVATGPTITMLQNNYGNILPGMPNYGIAPSSLFVIKGTGLANANTPALQSSAAPGIPKQLQGASISVTVNGTTVQPGMYYAVPTQIAAVLPANTPSGTGTITVTYNGTPSAAFPITVVSTALGLDTYFGGGTGLGVATDAVTGQVFYYNNPAKPGQTIVLWGSGLGAEVGNDTTFATPTAINVPLQIYIGGIQAQIQYQGGSGYPGVNQINVVIPANVQLGCGVSLIGVSGTITTNSVSLPISADGSPCSDPVLGPGNSIVTGSTYRIGTVEISQETSAGTTTADAGAAFFKYTSTVTGGTANTITGLYSIGSCYVIQSSTNPGGTPSGTVTTTGLDAGAITVSGPVGSAQTLTSVPSLAGEYSVLLPAGFIPATGGNFTFSGAGGKDVGPFSVNLNYGSPLVWTNNTLTSISRSQGQTVTWTGGAPASYVLINGGSVNTAAAVSGSFLCYAPVSAGQFTIPAPVLLSVPAGTGSLSVENAITPVPFTANGLDLGIGFVFEVSSDAKLTYQ